MENCLFRENTILSTTTEVVQFQKFYSHQQVVGNNKHLCVLGSPAKPTIKFENLFKNLEQFADALEGHKKPPFHASSKFSQIKFKSLCFLFISMYALSPLQWNTLPSPLPLSFVYGKHEEPNAKGSLIRFCFSVLLLKEEGKAKTMRGNECSNEEWGEHIHWKKEKTLWSKLDLNKIWKMHEMGAFCAIPTHLQIALNLWINCQI